MMGKFAPVEEQTNVVARPASIRALVGRHPAVRAALETIARIATSNCTVLVSGESGTGKAIVVDALHDASERRAFPLGVVHCGAIPENQLEAEIARQLDAIEGGTLFLDEIGELTPATQVKVLRLVQQRDHDVRIVAATNRDLEHEVAAGRFREDLFYWVSVIHVALPPLRERAEDIVMLAEHFFETAKWRAGRADLDGFSEEALCAIRSYEWPGNVRALENAVERGVLLATGSRVRIDDLPARVRACRPSGVHAVQPAVLPKDGIDLRAAVDLYETALVKLALERTGNNKNAAAQLLKMNRTTLVEMIKRKGL